MDFGSSTFPLRPAWVEIDLGRLRRNLRLIRRDLPRPVHLLAVLKDEAYGHGALDVVRIALEEGAWGLGVSTLEEAMTLRDAGIAAPMLLLGERQEAELPWCVEHNLTVCVNETHTVRKLAEVAAAAGKQVRCTSNPHRHEPLRRAVGRSAAARGTDLFREIAAIGRRDDPFFPVG